MNTKRPAGSTSQRAWRGSHLRPASGWSPLRPLSSAARTLPGQTDRAAGALGRSHAGSRISGAARFRRCMAPDHLLGNAAPCALHRAGAARPHLHAGTPVAILSGNSIEHALLALACMYTGVPYAPIAPSYSLASAELTTLRYLWQRLEPALVFAADGAAFERPLSQVLDSRTEVVTLTPAGSLPTTPFAGTY